MLRSVLVGLDADEDTSAATDMALWLAGAADATVRGVAVVDTQDLAMEATGHGFGTEWISPEVFEQLGDELRRTARGLLDEFEERVTEAGLEYRGNVIEGLPHRGLLGETKYADLLVVGRESHFFYARPEQDTHTVQKLLRQATGPTLVVGDQVPDRIDHVLWAYHGSFASAHAMQRFVQLWPNVSDLSVEILSVYKSSSRQPANWESQLKRAVCYLEDHGVNCTLTERERGQPGRAVLEELTEGDAQLLVAGAHPVSRLWSWLFGSTTESLLAQSPVPLFLAH